MLAPAVANTALVASPRDPASGVKQECRASFSFENSSPHAVAFEISGSVRCADRRRHNVRY